jgi:N-acetylmuramoyl-L-alanine amidase
MKTNKILFIIDNGHGGVINGVPQTAGKRSPDFGDGILYEGVSNRRLAQKLTKRLELMGIDYFLLVPELEDISLAERVKRVNRLANLQKSILLSIHSDAFTTEHAHGWSVYTTKGGTKSDDVATILYKYAKAAGLHIRDDYSDGDPDKEADFYILRKTVCPAVLIENLFMTNKEDYKTLLSKEGQDKLTRVIVNSIKEIAQNGI